MVLNVFKHYKGFAIALDDVQGNWHTLQDGKVIFSSRDYKQCIACVNHINDNNI